MNRLQIAELVLSRLQNQRASLQAGWKATVPINHFVLDDVLPVDLVHLVREAFPDASSMRTRKSLRELKYVSAQMNRHPPLLEEVLYAFQDRRVVELVGRITGLQGLEPDEQLYAGGISMMAQGHFLNPHLDNSHDIERRRYRLLNLLYYVSPGWEDNDGGHLELWPEGPAKPHLSIQSKFNRLVVMITHRSSWHSVAPVRRNKERCCVSNYYFSVLPPNGENYFHVTTFRGRPEQRLRNAVLVADGFVRHALRTVFPRGAIRTTHYYKQAIK